MTLQTKKNLCVLGIIIGAVNFFIYLSIADRLGGDAVNGRSENEHYFLASHGHETQVSRAAFTFSRIHTYSVWITHPLAIASGVILFSLIRRNESERPRHSTP